MPEPSAPSPSTSRPGIGIALAVDTWSTASSAPVSATAEPSAALVKTATSMLVELGRDVYAHDFEAPFLHASTTFYQAESQEYISHSSASDFLKKVEQRLNEEAERVAHYLDPATEPRLREVAERELIARHMRTVAEMEHSGIIAMIEDNKVDDLRRAYELFINSTLQELVWDNVTYTAPEYTELPWGLGAWGAGSVRAYRMIDEPDRTAFIEGANESLNSGRYPKLKMSVYFDSTDQNTGETCAIGNVKG